MTTRTGIHLFIHALGCALLGYIALIWGHKPLGAVAFALAGLMPLCVRQKHTALYVCALVAVLAQFMPQAALVLAVLLWGGFLLLPKVPVPPTKSEMAELRRAAERTSATQELGNVRMTPSGSTYVVDRQGSWRRVKAS